MARNKKKVVLVVALGCAVAVFALDRLAPDLLPGGPVSAEASFIDTRVEPPGLDIADRPLPPAPQPDLADRLRELADRDGLDVDGAGDAFCPADAWYRAGGEEPVVVEEQPLPADPAELFAARHTLAATVIAAGGGTAIVGGRCLAVGKSLDGFRLAAVDERSATFVRGASRVVLRLPQRPVTPAEP